MREVVRRVQGTGHVLKGGCALVFAYGIRRHSTDIDFDAAKPTDMTRRIRNGLRAAGAEMRSRELIRTRTSLRIRATYRVRGEGKEEMLKVDTRFRPKPVAAETVDVGGILTNRPEALFEQKLVALESRTVPRDLYDLEFIIGNYGDALTDR